MWTMKGNNQYETQRMWAKKNMRYEDCGKENEGFKIDWDIWNEEVHDMKSGV